MYNKSREKDMEKVKLDLNTYDTRCLLAFVSSASIDAFMDKGTSNAITSILKETVKRLGSSAMGNGIKSVKVHEAWALYNALTSVEVSVSDTYEYNLLRELIAKLHKSII